MRKRTTQKRTARKCATRKHITRKYAIQKCATRKRINRRFFEKRATRKRLNRHASTFSLSCAFIPSPAKAGVQTCFRVSEERAKAQKRFRKWRACAPPFRSGFPLSRERRAIIFLMLLFCAVSSYASGNSKQTTAEKPMNFTPENADDPKITALLAEIRRVGGGILSDARPFYVPVFPDSSNEVNNCFVAVSERIEKDGGESIIGWTLRKETMLMSAEFHSIWKSPAGKLLDITSKGIPLPGQSIIIPTSRILFVLAPGKTYEGKPVNNINLNISGNPLMDDYIACCNAIFNITNRGERAHQREITRSMLSAAEENALRLLVKSCKNLLSAARAGCKTKNSPCFCGSGEKFKFCCGEVVRKALKSVRE